MKTSKEIEQEAKVKDDLYQFTPDSLAAYKSAVCREQRLKCFKAAEKEIWDRYRAINTRMADAILYAPEPE